MVLDLQESHKEDAESSHVPLTWFSLLLTSYIASVHLWQPRNQYWDITGNWTPDFI